MLLGAGLALLLAPVCLVAQKDKGKKEAEPTFEVKALKVRVSGPYVHENMAVFLLHSGDQDKRNFITLDQGLDKKTVAVSEKAQEQVGELVIENNSDKYLFLQEGDRVQGGKQDRIIVTSLVVPPKSGKMPLPTFCCEQSRWTLGTDGKSFKNVDNAILSGKDIRYSAKGGGWAGERGGQAGVWREVARQKMEAQAKLGSKNTNSSLNETLDSKEVKKICADCDKAYKELLGKHPDAIGVAVAVNGKVEEINIYPNTELFARLFPRLVQSYAVQAGMDRDKLKGKPAPAVATEDVDKFMSAGKEKAKGFRKINTDNGMRFRDLEKEAEFVTAYKGEPIHRQWISKPPPPPEEKKEKK
jgi:hypothetical protein